jgi:chitosanase
MSPEQRRRTDQIVSVFENGTTVLQYAYVERLDDGRGYTVGRGFTTANGDALAVVRAYTEAKPDNRLAPFLPTLQQLVATTSDDTSGLPGFPAEWRAAAADPAFRAAQDKVVDQNSFVPAMAHAETLGMTSALGRAILFDTVFQHGDDPDPDGAPALITRASAAAGGPPGPGVPERVWLGQFLTVRRADLAHSANAASRAAWAQSVTRVDVWRSILDRGNLALDGPITFRFGGDPFVIA